MLVKVFFLGRNLDGILRDAETVLPEGGEVVVVTREGDTLSLPEGLEARRATPVEAIEVLQGLPERSQVELVANGGTTAQLVPLLRTLFVGDCPGSYRVWDLQRDGATLLAECG